MVCQLLLLLLLGYPSEYPIWRYWTRPLYFWQVPPFLELQVYCYEDSKLLKLFSQILRILYDADVLGEDAILFWYKRGSHPKGRNVFLHDVEPFIKWLEEAEEEGEEEE